MMFWVLKSRLKNSTVAACFAIFKFLSCLLLRNNSVKIADPTVSCTQCVFISLINRSMELCSDGFSNKRWSNIVSQHISLLDSFNSFHTIFCILSVNNNPLPPEIKRNIGDLNDLIYSTRSYLMVCCVLKICRTCRTISVMIWKKCVVFSFFF